VTTAGKLTLADVERARERVASYVRTTPLVHSRPLSEAAGCAVHLKLENRQLTGSFKPRGALNKILSLDSAARDRGLVAASAGNHALGVAHACEALGLTNADLFVQRNAAPAKIAKLRRYPLRLHLEGDTFEAAQQAAFRRVHETGATFVSAYDDPAVVAGQGTVGLEILEDLPDPDVVVVPVGGGALSAGIALAIRSRRPGTRVVGVNPAASPSALLSFRKGEAIDPYDHEPTLAHGLAGGYGRVAYDVARDLLEGIVLVSEDEMKRGIPALIDAEQELAEASGIVALAAVLSGKVARLEGNVVVVISGGNIDSATLREVLQ
jgi:threonine dehydratase